MDAGAELRKVRAEIAAMLESRNVGGRFVWASGEQERYDELCRREKLLLALVPESGPAAPAGRR